MNKIRNELVATVYNRALALTDYNIQNTLDKRFEFRKKIIRADKSLTENEKSYAMEELNKDFDYHKVLFNEGTKRICENCHDECLATLFCEHCVRNYLKENFSNWTSGNNDIDDLIQQCQSEILSPDKIVEWIPYNKFENINFLTKGGCSEIYTADWINGSYDEWDSKEKQLKRFGDQVVVLKKLENVENANRSWFEEGKSHLSISSKYSVVECYGLTKDPSDGNYMLVMNHMDINLREYIQQNHNKLTWKERIQIIKNITFVLSKIHQENTIHRDLHSGNILLGPAHVFRISDFGFCGPADKPLNSVYGNLPYIAPEVISGKETTFASDIYSIGILISNTSSRLFTSKVYQFKNLPEPKNATEEEQEAFYSKPYSYNIPDNIDDIVNKNDDNTSKSSGKINDDKKLSEALGNMQINSNNNIQNDYIKEFILAEKHNNDDIDDENGIYNNPNLYPEEQDEFEIPDGNYNLNNYVLNFDV
ncbi:kinase-like domain-containing protein [Rhizophagus clarus]|uniref:Kinase-like domain-containing protein n=1 Tax=Rhizophagus clarus TaxID=94130 RepID=A0A8H3QF12_9GLOM|nr:kinase-like domain-containing protein [Rhizophagus clarus]